jgi:molecular chaperone DnaK (HSP70)
VDLGTTFSVVGINRNGVVSIIPDSAGRLIFPSMVSFLESEIAVGYEARAHMSDNPLNTIYNAKRFIGKS